MKVIMPDKLTAENGAKAIFTGEFFIEIEIENQDYCGCNECHFCDTHPEEQETIMQKHAISWTTIKEIYKLAVKEFSQPFN